MVIRDTQNERRKSKTTLGNSKSIIETISEVLGTKAHVKQNGQKSMVWQSLTKQENKTKLTTRQFEILSLIEQKPEISNRQIADILVVATTTVRNHLSILYNKLDVNNRHAALKQAQELGLLVGSNDPPIEVAIYDGDKQGVPDSLQD